MPTCFVSMIALYSIGFEKLNDLSEETILSIEKAREIEITNILELQFILSYLGNISKEDSDNMTPFELNNWYKLLKKQKELEASKVKEAAK